MWSPSSAPQVIELAGMMLRPLAVADRQAWERAERANAEWRHPWRATTPEGERRAKSFRAILAARRRSRRAGTGMDWVIWTADATGPVVAGEVIVQGVEWGAARSASLGYWVDARQVGRGIAPRAVAAVIDHAFASGLHRLEVNVRPENAASLRVLSKLGLREEGRRERFLHIDGAWRDHRSFAVTADEVSQGELAARLTLP